MSMGRIAVVTAAACVVSISAFAQSSSKTSSSKAQRQSMTLTGCLMGEKDYKARQSGKASSASAKADDEFVLVESTAASCTETASGKAYRLVGKRSHDLKQFVGHRIEITGAFEEKRDAQVAAGEKKSSLPPEVTVTSFREVTASVAPAPAAVASAAPEPAPAPEPSPAPESTVARNEPPAARQDLPKTASSLPLVGLIGLVSLTAAFGLRLARPRAS